MANSARLCDESSGSSRCWRKNQNFFTELGENNNAGSSRPKSSALPCHSCMQDLSSFSESDTEVLSHQIAGHSAGQTAVLKHRLGYVLKRVQKPPLGQREVDFYRRVFDESTENSTHLQLRQFIPRFYGVTNVEFIAEGPTAVRKQYLVLEDICQGYKYPCVVDVKIGVKTWDPLATQAKIDHENSKYTGTKGPLGISVTGMQVYDLVGKTTIKRDKEFGNQLSVDSIQEAFTEFLNCKVGIHRCLATKLVELLEPVKTFFESQVEYAFYSSSLLIAYDASDVEQVVTNGQYQDADRDGEWKAGNFSDVIRVKMIDFAHVFPNSGDRDRNYMCGLDNLIKIFSAIAKGPC